MDRNIENTNNQMKYAVIRSEKGTTTTFELFFEGHSTDSTIYSRHQKKVPISRPYNGTGNPVPFPFNFRAVAVLKPFPFCPTGSPSVLVNGPYGVI